MVLQGAQREGYRVLLSRSVFFQKLRHSSQPTSMCVCVCVLNAKPRIGVSHCRFSISANVAGVLCFNFDNFGAVAMHFGVSSEVLHLYPFWAKDKLNQHKSMRSHMHNVHICGDGGA